LAKYNLIEQNGASPDFVTGVTSVLIEKNKSRPAWSPGSIEEVLEKDIVTKFFSDIDSSIPSLELDPSRKIGAHINFGLPSEDQIRRYVVGLDKDNSVSAVTYEDIVRKFEEDYAGKDGLSEKLSDVVTRKCEMVQDPGNFETLRWK
jgi:3-hydroxyisobutyryl-CoA hydrolase